MLLNGTQDVCSAIFISQATFFNLVASFTGTSQADLQHQFDTAKGNYFTQEVNIFSSRATALEHEAYAVSDPIAPQYMIQNCGRF